MDEIDHDKNLAKIFKNVDPITHIFSARETGSVEFKESFNWGNKDEYAKT
ncbi:MAG TPA: hypothetical protein VG621_03695 [Candidatus Paceibacterota bacterium]|nr:hypothetical protein [Candidatus Paceibacterota bacterium]